MTGLAERAVHLVAAKKDHCLPLRWRSIGSQGRGARKADPVPHPPFDLYVRFSRIQLTDGLIDMVTLPSGSG